MFVFIYIYNYIYIHIYIYIQGVLKNGNKGHTDLVVIGFSKTRPLLKSTYNFRFNESNFRLVDLKITILKAPKVSICSE